MLTMAEEVSPSKRLNEHVQVRYTGDWSSDSKLSAVANGYWEDPFLSLFNKVDPVPKRTSLICRGYYVRFRVCDYFLRSILKAADGPIQIVSLGCGMDTTFFRMLPEFESKIAHFFELDFESVIQAKKQIIFENEVLKLMQSEKLTLIGADLRKISTLKDILANANLDFNLPTLFYSECVVNYLMPNESEEILKWIVKMVPNSMWLAYEQCFSDDSFGIIMSNHFERNGCSLLSLPTTPDMETQKEQLKAVGFHTSHVFNVWDSFLHLTEGEQCPFPDTPKQMQFDEYEALLATCMHYSVRLGTCGNIGTVLEFISAANDSINHAPPTFLEEASIVMGNNSSDLMLYQMTNKLSHHTSVVCHNKDIIVFGGVEETSHRSCTFKKVIYPPSVDECEDIMKTECIREDKELFERLHSAAVFHPATKSFYIFGGRKSPRVPCDNSLVQVSCCRSSYVIKQLNFADGASPCARWRHSVSIISENLILFGGKNEKEIFGDCWMFTFLEGKWSQLLSTTAPSERHSHSMCADTDLNVVYCIGGVGKNDTELCEDSVWRYEGGDCGQWTNIPEFNVYGRRIGHSVAFNEDMLFIVGGYGANSSYNLDHFITIIDLLTNGVKVCNLSPGPYQMFLPFGFSLSMVTKEDSEITEMVVYGGGGNCFSFGTYYNTLAMVFDVSNNHLSFFD